MSTKIRTAYVLRDRRRLWSVCRMIRERCEAIVRRELATLYRALIADAEAANAKNKLGHPFRRYCGPDGAVDALGASRFVRDQFVAQLGRAERDPFDLTVSVAIRQARDGRILMIPYPGTGYLSGVLDFLRRVPELRDHHYQNATDRSRGVSARAWARRRRAWEPLLGRGEWRHMLVLSIVSPDGWLDVCPAFDMVRAEARRRRRRRGR